MRVTVRLLALLFLTPCSLLPQSINSAEAGSFADALFLNKPSLTSWIDPASWKFSNRLGVTYEGVIYKPLISYDFDDSVKSLVKSDRLKYSTTVEPQDHQFARVKISLTDASGSKEFYFKGKKMVSPLEFLTRGWSIIETDHFRFILSDSTLSNPYCRSELESFISRMAKLLDLSDKEMQNLQKKKIYYYLCKDEDEILSLTGYRARGMANLAYDAVITTYNFHAHELLHLLINYKLRRLPLYTHPFLQEGFAVAFGGRGGLGPNSLLNVAKFLFQTQFVELESILDGEAFRQQDASLSYSSAGLYNRFLLEKLGPQSYLQLYRTHSAGSARIASQRITLDELPDSSAWNSYISGEAVRNPITLDTMAASSHLIFNADSIRISEDSSHYYFRIDNVALLAAKEHFPSYRSKSFEELLPGRKYNGAKYLIRASAGEISIYNLFTNTLIDNYAASLSMLPMQIVRSDGKYTFGVRKEIFENLIFFPLANRKEK